jgi:predicted DNA-binding transcriptional regulator AlpA
MTGTLRPLCVSAKAAAAVLGISERSFHALRAHSDFPQPRSLAAGGRCLRWSIAELEQWLAARPAVVESEPTKLQRGREIRSLGIKLGIKRQDGETSASYRDRVLRAEFSTNSQSVGAREYSEGRLTSIVEARP